MPNLLAGVRRERCEELRLDLDEPAEHFRARAALRSPKVPRPSRLDVEVPMAKGRLVVHPLHRGPSRLNGTVQDTEEPGVDAVPLGAAPVSGAREPEPIAEPRRSRGRELEVQIRVVEAVPGVRHRHADRIRPPFPNRVADVPYVPFRLRHLATLEANPAVDPVPARPQHLRKHGGVDERTERHVVLYQVFARVSQVDRVPEYDFLAQDFNHLDLKAQAAGDRPRASFPEEDVIDEGVVQALRTRADRSER